MVHGIYGFHLIICWTDKGKMANKLNKIEVVSEYKHIHVREITDLDGYFRRLLSPDMTLADDEHQEVKDIAEAEWTDEVKTAWATFQAEQEAELSALTKAPE